MVRNYPFHNLRVNTQPITFYARFFLGGQTVAGNCKISNIPTLSSSMAAVKAKKIYLSPLICVKQTRQLAEKSLFSSHERR